jgi:hypothetical protein
MQDQADIRQARIYFETLQKALDLDRTPEQARSIANNALTRAGLARMDFFENLIKNKRGEW